MQKNLSSFISIWMSEDQQQQQKRMETRENNSATLKAFFASHKH